MRTHTFRSLIWRTAFIFAAGWAGPVAAPAQDAVAPAGTNSHSFVLQGADAMWADLVKANQPPPGPAEWRDKPPTAEEKQRFFKPHILAAAEKAKEFYTTYPSDPRASSARVLECRALFLTLVWGDTSHEARFDTAATALLKDPSVPEDERASLLSEIAGNMSAEKSRPFLELVAKGPASEKLKAFATGYLDKMKALGQPVSLGFIAVDGRHVDLSEYKGKVVLIDFWATWCPPCRGEVPNVKKTYDQYHAKGFEIIGISLDSDKDALKQFVADNKMEWPQFYDGKSWANKYAQQFGIESIPTMWLIDKKGVLRDMNAREDLGGGVQKLLAE